jgi:hypothetical protein
MLIWIKALGFLWFLNLWSLVITFGKSKAVPKIFPNPKTGQFLIFSQEYSKKIYR